MSLPSGQIDDNFFLQKIELVARLVWCGSDCHLNHQPLPLGAPNHRPRVPWGRKEQARVASQKQGHSRIKVDFVEHKMYKGKCNIVERGGGVRLFLSTQGNPRLWNLVPAVFFWTFIENSRPKKFKSKKDQAIYSKTQ